MKRRTRFVKGFHLTAGVLAILLMSQRAGAEVLELRASVSSQATRISGDGSGSTDSSVESFPGTTETLPMRAFAGLGDFLGAFEIPHGARGVASFSDPARGLLINPGELGVEADAHSETADIAYEVVTDATETRSILLTPRDLFIPEPGISKDVTSTLFLEGGMLVWSADPERDLTGITAEIGIRIVQETSTNGEIAVLDVGLELRGQPGGAVTMDQQGNFTALLGGPQLLLASGDVLTASVVSALAAEGRLNLALVPAQPVRYRYAVIADEPFKLRLEVRCRATCLPEGTGVAVVFGRPFQELAGIIGKGPFDVSGDAVQRVVNRAIQDTPVPQAQPEASSLPLCGAFGLETAALMGMLSVCGVTRRRHLRQRGG